MTTLRAPNVGSPLREGKEGGTASKDVCFVTEFVQHRRIHKLDIIAEPQMQFPKALALKDWIMLPHRHGISY